MIQTWHKHVSAVALPIDAYLRTPRVSTNAEFTHACFAVHENAAAYGRNISAYETHAGTPALEEMLAEVQSCTSALWTSWQVFAGDSQAGSR